MQIQFCGAAKSVTGSQHLLSLNGKKLLLDCGLFQGHREEAFDRNKKLPFDPASIDAMILSHAHIDHSGNIPNLVKNGFNKNIFCTKPTVDLCNVMLQDSAHIQERDVEYLNYRMAKRNLPPREPIYTVLDAQDCLKNFVGFDYGQTFEPIPNVKATFYNAGHMFGSAMLLLEITENGNIFRLGFTGDLGRKNLPIIQDPDQITGLDILISESTYGNKVHDPAKEIQGDLVRVINDTVKKNGKIVIPAAAQELLKLPDISPGAAVSQVVGIASVEINYHSPAVKGREVWGKLVPYGFDSANAFGNGKPMPWRAGANENTTITFSHDAQVEGKPIKAGTYGLFMVPGKDQWTIIFSANSTSWGHFFYEESEDVLRVMVKPTALNDFQERLIYCFDNTDTKQTTANLRWEKLKIPFTITFDTPSIVVANLKNQLRGRNAFQGAQLMQGVNYCVQNNIALDQALQWAERAIRYNGGAQALFAKANLLDKLGRRAEAEPVRKMAIDNGTEGDLNNYGYNLLGEKKFNEAIDIFKINAKKHPESWNAFDSLGEAQDNAGDKKSAIENYTKALRMVKDEPNKKRIEGILKNLNSSK